MIPGLLRLLFRRRREPLTELARAGAEAIAELVRRAAGGHVQPGLVVCVATAGDLLQRHPHLPDGAFRPAPEWEPTLPMGLFRQRVLARLLENTIGGPAAGGG